jgi:hypothetical protein
MNIRNPLKVIYKGYLKDHGWLRSFFGRRAVNGRGEPIPWLMYSFIDYFLNLEDVGTRFKKMTFLEYGAGNSTIFFAKYFKTVTSIEHNRKWVEEVRKQLPKNAKIIYKKLDQGGNYSKAASATGKKYDLILVDGRDRINSLKESAKCLTSKGILILDNSDRPHYIEGRNQIKKKGFKELQFWGVAPGSHIKECTSVFYRKENIFGI